MRVRLSSTLLLCTALTWSATAGSSPADAADAFGISGCSGVRPGAEVREKDGDLYTMGFLFTGTNLAGTDPARYVSTVGDFVLNLQPGTKVWGKGKGPVAYDANARRVGRFVYAYLRDTPAYRSFGLIRLDPTVKSSARVCHFGGPTGIYTSRGANPVFLEYYGQGLPQWFVFPARTAWALGTPDREWVYAHQPAGLGDEGAPVLAGGRAVGLITGGVGLTGAHTPPQTGFLVARIGPWEARAEKALKIKLGLLKGSRVSGGLSPSGAPTEPNPPGLPSRY